MLDYRAWKTREGGSMKKVIASILVMGFMLIPTASIYAETDDEKLKEERDECIAAATLTPINTILCWGEYAIEKIASIF